ncbi:MAG: hypothetical protein HDS37_04775 [Bacteroides sp.]|nr:hypothetical protein [Bacteroides sp.]
MTKRIFVALAIMASVVAIDMVFPNADITGNVCMAYDQNSDGYIYKGTIYLTRVASGRQDQFYLFNKRGVDYVAISKRGPYYRLAHRMTINNIDYKY